MADGDPLKGQINFSRLFSDLDTDGSGQLDIGEFRECFHWKFIPSQKQGDEPRYTINRAHQRSFTEQEMQQTLNADLETIQRNLAAEATGTTDGPATAAL